MNRYRSNGPLDDQSIVDGDDSLVGVTYYDTPENIPPGLCQAATNVDFTTQDAITRGGFVCLPALGNSPFLAGINWENQVSANDVNWRAITFGNGVFVAISNSGTAAQQVMTSTDGVTWIARTSAAANSWSSVAFGNGKFVAVSNDTVGNCVMTSSDGITWASVNPGLFLQWQSICYGAGLFVVVAKSGTGNRVMTSPDGTTWTSRTSAADNSWSSVCFGNGLFVAVSITGSGNRVMTSPDGITWTSQTSSANNIWTSVCYGSLRYVAVSSDGVTSACMTSEDGITWTTRTTPGAGWLAIAYGNALYVAVSDSGATATSVMTSPDGINWTYGVASSTNQWAAVTNALNTFVAVAISGTGNRVMTYGATSLVWGSGRYSDPNSTDTPWIVLAGATKAGFFSFGQTSRSVSYPAGFTISEQSCVVQANNFLFIFGGSNATPIYWDGSWGGSFIVVPASVLGTGFMSIPASDSALYYQNRLWVVDGKDVYAASQSLVFTEFNDLTDAFNLNVGTSDFIVTSYPFGNNAIVVFKNHSSYLLQNVQGALTAVTSTEITRQLGIVGVNAVTAVGPDLVYVSSDRNITSVRLNIQNATQAITVPLSRNITPLMNRVNWNYGYKISVGYWNNYLFVAMPFDNATVCNTVLVYNFVTNQWFGEWNFSSSINMAIQGWVTANYLGQIRMHAITEDGRIFVVNEGHLDVSGTTVADISMSMTSRSYPMNNENRFNRRMWADLATNRPNFSITGYVDGVSESSALITNQTYSRSTSFLFPTPTYSFDNSSDDYMQAFRKDYAALPSESVQPQSGFLPESNQEYRLPLIFRRNGRLVYYKISNTTGTMTVNGIGGESRAGYRSNLIQPG